MSTARFDSSQKLGKLYRLTANGSMMLVGLCLTASCVLSSPYGGIQRSLHFFTLRLWYREALLYCSHAARCYLINPLRFLYRGGT